MRTARVQHRACRPDRHPSSNVDLGVGLNIPLNQLGLQL
jgi:hypothetical protein